MSFLTFGVINAQKPVKLRIIFDISQVWRPGFAKFFYGETRIQAASQNVCYVADAVKF